MSSSVETTCSIFPEKIEFVTNVDDGAEVAQVGEDSTQWYSGSSTSPANLLSSQPKASKEIDEILNEVSEGRDLTETQIVKLFNARGGEVHTIVSYANSFEKLLTAMQSLLYQIAT